MKRRAFMIAGGAATLAVIAGVAAQPAARVIPVRTFRWAFDPSTIELKKGEPVVFELTANDVFMGFSMPDFKVRTDVVPGKTQRLALTPDKSGTFTFLCDIFCGDGHESMHGTLVVT
jgi:cytochrome c oxidase subunit 2